MRRNRGPRLLMRLLFLVPVPWLLAAPPACAVPLEVYGRLPALEEVSVSPDGSRLAFVRTSGNTRLIEVISLEDRKVLGRLGVGDQKLRRVAWADSKRLMIETSETTLPWGFSGTREYEWVQLQIYDLATRETRQLPSLDRTPDTNLMNVIDGNVMVRTVNGRTVLFVPGVYAEDRTLPALVRIDLDRDSERIIRKGRDDSTWLVDNEGEVVAEHVYNDQSQRWSLKLRRDGRLTEVVSGKEAIDFPRLLGFGPSSDTLLIQRLEDGSRVWRLLSTKDGTFGPPMAQGRDLDAPIEDPQTHRMIGGISVDDDAKYFFFEPTIQARWKGILRAFEGDHVRFVSASNDYKKIIVLVDGPNFGYQYELVDIDKGKALPVGNAYEGLTAPLQVRRITYPAGDGLAIPAYLTLPPRRSPVRLPLVVLPHGGPADRDTAEFGWWPQALAEQGYAVLQPNYRGSTVSHQHLVAGYGEFGRKMQTDLSDGVRYLAREGIADPARVCIAGGSYGGYAALAGVTLDPGVYRCAVSVAGISDLRRMLKGAGRETYEQRYWDRFLGVTGPDDPTLDGISPIKHLDAVKVPVLLIHGKDDTVVAFEQSEYMADALRRAKKPVDFVTLEGEDHLLSRGETRLRMLKATVDFLEKHNPPDPPAAP